MGAQHCSPELKEHFSKITVHIYIQTGRYNCTIYLTFNEENNILQL